MAEETKKDWMQDLEQFEPDLFWQKYSRHIIWGTVGVLVLFGLFFFWQTQRDQARELAATRLAQANDVAALQQLLQQYPADEISAPALIKLGDLHYREKRYAEAAAAFERLLNAFPTHLLAEGARLGLAAIKESQGNLQEARSLYQQLIQAYPQGYTLLSAHMGLARTTELLGQKQEARHLYQEVLARSQGSARQHEALLRWTVLGREVAPVSATNAPAAPLGAIR